MVDGRGMLVPKSNISFNNTSEEQYFPSSTEVGLDHEAFLQQLKRTESGRFETRLPWKDDHVPLPTHKNLCKSRLLSTTRKLERMGRLEEYDEIMRNQIE